MKIAVRFAAAFMMLFLVSCTKDYLVQPEPPSSVSFSNDVIPIFNNNCVSCHGDNGVSPNLTPDKAYTSLLSDPGLVQSGNPDGSELYQMVTGQNGSVMPPSGMMPKSKTDIIYQWIKDGAQNN